MALVLITPYLIHFTAMSEDTMIRELRKKSDELQAERSVIDEKLAAVNKVIEMFEDSGKGRNPEATVSGVSGRRSEISEILRPPSDRKGPSSANGRPQKIPITQ